MWQKNLHTKLCNTKHVDKEIFDRLQLSAELKMFSEFIQLSASMEQHGYASGE